MPVTILNPAVGTADSNSNPVAPSAGVDRYWRITYIYDSSSWASRPTQIQVSGDTNTTLDRIHSFTGTDFQILTFGCKDADIGTNPSIANGSLSALDGALPPNDNLTIVIGEVFAGVDQTTPFTDTINDGYDVSDRTNNADIPFTIDALNGALCSVVVVANETALTWALTANGYTAGSAATTNTAFEAHTATKSLTAAATDELTTFGTGSSTSENAVAAFVFLPTAITTVVSPDTVDINFVVETPTVQSGLIGEHVYPDTVDIQLDADNAEVVAGPPEFPGLIGQLSNYTASTGVLTFSGIGNNGSGCGYNHETKKVYVVRNNTAEVFEYNEGDYDNLIRIITVSTNYKDTEGVTYLGDNRIGVASENGSSYRQIIFTIPTGTTNVNVVPDQTLFLAESETDNNSGLEGNTINLATGVCYGVGEGEQASTPRKFLQWTLPVDQNTDYNHAEPELDAYEPWDADTVFTGSGSTLDLSGCCFDHTSGNVIISSHRGRKVMLVDPANGNILDELPATDLSQIESVQILSNGTLLIGGEANEYQLFVPNLGEGEVSATFANIEIVTENATVSSFSTVAPIEATSANINFVTYRATVATGQLPVISPIPHATIALGNTYSYTPALSNGEDPFWFKEYGPDSMTVDPEDGSISWDSSVLLRGQGIKVGIGCSNESGQDIAWFVIHVDNTGTSKLLELGIDTVSPYIRIACQESIVNGGDTLVVPSGHRYASVTADQSFENTFADANVNEVPEGTNLQMTTIMSEDFTIIDAGPHDGIPRQDEALELLMQPNAPSNYVKWSGLEWTGNNRQAINCGATHNVFELVGATDSGYNLAPTTFVEADGAYGSVAAGYLHGEGSVWENSYCFGQFRYGLQFGVSMSNTVMSRCIARPDEYHGDQPRGALVHYTVSSANILNNFVIDGDQEHLSPFYKNYAGAFGLPATGNETVPEDQLMNCNMAINNQMVTLTNDASRASDTPDFTVKNLVAAAVTSTDTPQTGSKSPFIFRTKLQTDLDGFTFYDASPYPGSSYNSAYLVQSGSNNTFEAKNGIAYRMGWDGAVNVNNGDFTSSNQVGSTLDNINIFDFPANVGGTYTTTSNVTTDTNPTNNGLDYLPRTEEGSPVHTAGQGANILTFAGPSNVLGGDVGWRDVTDEWCWPHPAEEHIASRMSSYSKSGLPVRNATIGVDPTDFTGAINGARGFAASGESFSEYIWGYLGRTVPPLRVEVKQLTNDSAKFYIGKYRSVRGDSITKFNLYHKTDTNNPVATFTGLNHTLTNIPEGTNEYVLRAVDPSKVTAYDGNEAGESGNSRTLLVTVDAVPVTSVDATLATINLTTYQAAVVSSPVGGTVPDPVDTYPIFMNYGTKPEIPDVMNSPILPLGDDVDLVAQLLRRWRFFSISTGTDIYATIISLDRRTQYTNPIAQLDSQSEANWGTSLVNVSIPANETATIANLPISWTNGIAPAWLEIQVRLPHGTKTFYAGVNLSLSTID